MDYGRYNCGDGERLKRRLGVITYIYRGKPHRQKLLHYKTAVEIIEGIGCDPVDAGL
jgi:hypothetical protein